MKEIAAAVIRRDGRLLLCRRAERPGDSCAGLWEFPGGKRAGESLEDCLVRECREELGVQVKPLASGKQLTHIYPEITVRLTFLMLNSRGRPETRCILPWCGRFLEEGPVSGLPRRPAFVGALKRRRNAVTGGSTDGNGTAVGSQYTYPPERRKGCRFYMWGWRLGVRGRRAVECADRSRRGNSCLLAAVEPRDRDADYTPGPLRR